MNIDQYRQIFVVPILDLKSFTTKVFFFHVLNVAFKLTVFLIIKNTLAIFIKHKNQKKDSILQLPHWFNPYKIKYQYKRDITLKINNNKT